MTVREQAAVGSHAEVEPTQSAAQVGAKRRAKIGDVGTKSEVFRAVHYEACRRVAMGSYAKEKATTPEK